MRRSIRKQVFVSGTWSSKKAEPFASDGFLLGKLLGQSGYDLATGPGTGMAGHVIDGFRSGGSVGVVRFYLPEQSEMACVGETVERAADDTIQTALDYPMRNVFQVSESVGVFVITGGDGTLEEILPALIDYALPVAIMAGTGKAARAARILSDELFPEWKDLLLIDSDVTRLFDWMMKRLDSGVGKEGLGSQDPSALGVMKDEA